MSDEKKDVVEHTNIGEALLAVMNDIDFVQSERSQGLSYAMKSEPAVLEAIRPILLKHGIVVYPVGALTATTIRDDVKRWDTKSKDWNDTHGFLTEIVVSFCFLHAPSITSITVPSYGAGWDYQDKAGAGGLTNAKKYALLNALLIITGEDPDRRPSEASITEIAFPNEKIAYVVDQELADDHTEVKRILAQSAMLVTANVTTIGSWFKHFNSCMVETDDEELSIATANAAFLKAKSDAKNPKNGDDGGSKPKAKTKAKTKTKKGAKK